MIIMPVEHESYHLLLHRRKPVDLEKKLESYSSGFQKLLPI